MTRVFVVDDHEIVRRGVADLIDSQDDLEVVGEAGTVAQAYARIAATLPDIAVLDVHLPDGSGIDLCRDVRSAFPDIHCLMLTAFDDEAASLAAVLAGADGYVVKDIRAQSLIDSIRRIVLGKPLITRTESRLVVAALVAPASPLLVPLTTRERQVLELIADGLTNRQIGEVLDLAEKTVKNYVSGLLRSLGMQRRTQAAVYGAELRAKGTPGRDPPGYRSGQGRDVPQLQFATSGESSP